jgi:hypothetical protein
MARYCSNCGLELADGDMFCGRCGVRQPAVETAAPPVGSPYSQAGGFQEAPAAPSRPPRVQYQDDSYVVSVPDWLTTDWMTPVQTAGTALVTGFLSQLVITGLLTMTVLLLAGVGFGDVLDPEVVLLGPLGIFLAFHGPTVDLGMWVTGMAWLAVAFFVGFRLLRPEARVAIRTRSDAWGFGIKTAIPYTVAVTVLLVVFEPDPLPVDSFFDPVVSSRWNIPGAFFLTLIVAGCVAAALVARRSNLSLRWLVGLDRFQEPPVVRGAVHGALRTLLIMVLGSVVFVFLATGLDLLGELSTPFFGLRNLGFILMTLVLAGVVWAGLDLGFILAVWGMSFLSDSFIGLGSLGGGFGVGDEPFWAWGFVIIAAAAFVLGGMRAAAAADSSTTAQAVGAGALVGPFVGIAGLVLSGIVFVAGSDLAGPALGYALLWSAASALGGFIYANQRNLPGRVRFQPAPPTGWQ